MEWSSAGAWKRTEARPDGAERRPSPGARAGAWASGASGSLDLRLERAAAFLLSTAARCSAGTEEEEGEAEMGELTVAAASDIVESAVEDGEEIAAEVDAAAAAAIAVHGTALPSLLRGGRRNWRDLGRVQHLRRRSFDSEQWRSGPTVLSGALSTGDIMDKRVPDPTSSGRRPDRRDRLDASGARSSSQKRPATGGKVSAMRATALL